MPKTDQIAARIIVPLERAVDETPIDDLGSALGSRLGDALGLPVSTVHVGGESDDLAQAIVAVCQPGSLIAMHSEHVNRWSGRRSTAEHIIDAWGGITAVAGPAVDEVDVGAGPILVPLDGSLDAERALDAAQILSDALGCGVALARVVPQPIGPDGSTTHHDADAYLQAIGTRYTLHSASVVPSNDPVVALAAEAERLDSPLIVLASRGDRSSQRASLSRTCSGLIAESRRPVAVVGPDWQPS